MLIKSFTLNKALKSLVLKRMNQLGMFMLTKSIINDFSPTIHTSVYKDSFYPNTLYVSGFAFSMDKKDTYPVIPRRLLSHIVDYANYYNKTWYP